MDSTKELRNYFVLQPSGNELFVSTDEGYGEIAKYFPFSRIREATEAEAKSYIRKLDDQRRNAEKLKKAKR